MWVAHFCQPTPSNYDLLSARLLPQSSSLIGVQPSLRVTLTSQCSVEKQAVVQKYLLLKLV